MAMIKAGWKRTIRIREYETETLDLGVEENSDLSGLDLIAKTVEMDRLLALAGDALLVERMKARMPATTSNAPAVQQAGRVSIPKKVWQVGDPVYCDQDDAHRTPTSSAPPEAPDVDPLI